MRTLAACMLGLFLIFFCTILPARDADAADSICGVWISHKQDVKIEIARGEKGLYYGKIVWAKPSHQEYVGKDVMKEIKFIPSSNQYVCPWIYDPKLDIVARAKITLSGNKLNLKATKGIISQTEVFTRVE